MNLKKTKTKNQKNNNNKEKRKSHRKMISPNRHARLPSCKREAQPPSSGCVRGHVSRTELSAGPGRGWSENKGPQHTLHPKGGTRLCSYREGGQDGQTVVEIHGKGNMEKEIINKCLRTKPTKLRVKPGGRWKGTALQNDASLRGMLGQGRAGCWSHSLLFCLLEAPLEI